MYYIYLLKSVSYPGQIYIGYTLDFEKRVIMHNAGKSPYTSKYRPWNLEMYFGFVDKNQAIKFEKYLKSGSGRAFIKTRLLVKNEI